MVHLLRDRRRLLSQHQLLWTWVGDSIRVVPGYVFDTFRAHWKHTGSKHDRAFILHVHVALNSRLRRSSPSRWFRKAVLRYDLAFRSCNILLHHGKLHRNLESIPDIQRRTGQRRCVKLILTSDHSEERQRRLRHKDEREHWVVFWLPLETRPQPSLLWEGWTSNFHDYAYWHERVNIHQLFVLRFLSEV